MTMKRAAIYCRISQDREGAGLGVERQRSDCEALARKLEWPVAKVYTDNDLSAYSGKPRPGYRALIADLDSGAVDSVIVWHTDRLHRSPRELEEYVDLCERRKIITQTVKAGELDLATPSGRAIARTLGAWARFEVEHKSERTKRAQLQAAQAGKWLGGAPPLGWTVRRDGSASFDRPAAARIKRASADVLAGKSLGSIVTAWNAAGFATGTGRTWSYATLRQVLTRARNAGLIELNGEIVAASTWPSIVTEDTWRAVSALLADPARRKSQSNRAIHLLAGIARCGKPGCGLSLRSATATGKVNRTVYRCPGPGKGHVARTASDVDAVVSGVLEVRLSRSDLHDLVGNDHEDTADLRLEALALRSRLNDAAESFADGAITTAQLSTITARVHAQLEQVEGSLSVGARGLALAGVLDAGDPVKAWKSANIEMKRAIVRALIDVVVVPVGRGGNRFAPESIRIDWRVS